KREPNDARLKIDLARQYENQGRFEDAKFIYLRLVSQTSSNPDFHFYLGSFYARFNQLNKARQAFDEALDYKPDHAATLDAMATLFGSEENKLLSAEVLNRSANLDPEGPARRISLIRSKLDEGEFNSALKLAISGQDLFPGHSSFIFLKGRAYDGSGNYRKAKSAFQESIKKDPEHVESYSALGDLYYSRGKYIYAALSYSDVVRLTPTDTESRFKQGLSYFKANEWGYAAAAWEDLLRYDPHHKGVRKYLPQAYYILAVEYNRLSESGLGQASFQKALSINRDSGAWLAGSMGTLGQYYRENKMYRESLAAFQEVIELRPRDADAYLGLGITYWKMKEQELARAAWQRSLELNPGNENNARGWMLLAKNKNSDS
ncbi:MAG: tetratricopeptide repeat protein, partial [Candidatus Neomarinimicrobiota bacterium]